MNNYSFSDINNNDQFSVFINKVRKQNKNKWYSITGIVNGKEIIIKGFSTWLQIFKIDGLDNSNCPDQNVTRFTSFLKTTFDHHFDGIKS